MKTKNGFTLIELLVVVVIISILTVIGLGQFFTAQKRGRDAQRKENLGSVAKALEMYYNDHGDYPLSSGGKIKVGGSVIDWGDEFTDTKTTYMKQLPTDPANNYRYYYETDGSGSYYKLYGLLEHSQDQDISGPYSGTDCGTAAGDQNCNYCIASPNAKCGD